MRYIAILFGVLIILLGMLAVLTGHQEVFPTGGGRGNSLPTETPVQVVPPRAIPTMEPVVNNPPQPDQSISCPRWDGPAGRENEEVVMNGVTQKCQRGAFGKGNWVPVPAP